MRVLRIVVASSVTVAAACADPVAPRRETIPATLAPAAIKYPLVKITPAIDSLQIGASAQLLAKLSNRSRTWTGTSIRWTSSDTTVLKIVATATPAGAAGRVTAVKAGRAVITARTNSATTGTLTIVVPGSGSAPPSEVPAPPDPGKPSGGFFVAPDGSSRGDGSAARPWDLATALSHPGTVQPGDTIWLRGGTYRGQFRSALTGSPSAHVVVRQYPGERATIDGNLTVRGASATYWGFEVMNSSASRPQVHGVDVHAPNSRFVNLVVHDHGINGFGFWSAAPDAEIYGSIIYNNGHQAADRGHGHGIYTQNSTGTKRLADNIIFNQFSHGIHVYGSPAAGLRGYNIEGNVSFNNGSLSRVRSAPDLLVGGGSAAERISVTQNFTYRGDGKTTATFGNYAGPTNGDLTLRDNYLVGTTKLTSWSSVNLTGNTFAGATTLMFLTLPSGRSASSYSWDRNSYVSKEGQWAPFSLTTNGRTQALAFPSWQGATGIDRSSGYRRGTPAGMQVFVRPNEYEPDRATVIVYNWDRRGSASVDVSNILRAGGRYEVRNAQNFYGAPVASGTYSGGSISLPLSGVSPASPVGGSASSPPSTGSEFHVFVITGSGSTTYASRSAR